MLVVLYLIAASLPWTLVEGRRGCFADVKGREDPCVYGTAIWSGNENEISYNLTVLSGSRICCEAYSCTNNECGFVDVRCHKNGNTVPIQIALLPWEVYQSVDPMMRCFDSIGTGVYYSYTAALVRET